MKKRITIEDLYLDADTFDEETVLLSLKGKITISEDNEILFATDPAKLKARRAILLYVLAKKVLKVNQKIGDETITSAEVTEKTKLNNNTVRARMSELTGEKLLVRSNSRYEIPSFKVAEVLVSLKGNGDRS